MRQDLTKRHVQQAVEDTARKICRSNIGIRDQRLLGLLNTRLTCPTCGAVPRVSCQHRINVRCCHFSTLLNRSEWRTEMQRGVQGALPATGEQRKQARGCERLERELWAGDFPLTVWPTSRSQSLNGVPGPKRSEATDGRSSSKAGHEYPWGCSAFARSLPQGFHLKYRGSKYVQGFCCRSVVVSIRINSYCPGSALSNGLIPVKEAEFRQQWRGAGSIPVGNALRAQV